MTETIRHILVGVTRGMWDSVSGCMKIYYLSRQEKVKSDGKKDEQTEISTVLAQRRAQQGKTRRISRKDSKEPNILQRIITCCAFNGGIFLMSILLFRFLLLPGLEWFTQRMFGGSDTHSHIWSYMGPSLTWTFNTLWILPLFVLSKIINTLWFQDIADTAYKRTRGRPQLPNFNVLIADVLFNLCLQTIFLIQGMLCVYIPIQGLGKFVNLLHMCFLHSLYSFEYKWFNMGWDLPKRVQLIEDNWTYFTGFGLPLALLTSLPQSYVISGCIFSILFPLFILSANEANPIDNKCGFPLRLFAVAAKLTNNVFLMSVKKRSSSLKEAAPDTR